MNSSGKTSCKTKYYKITKIQQISIKNKTRQHIITQNNTKKHMITQHITK